MSVEFRRRAVRQIDEIRKYIAARNAEAALGFLQEISGLAEQLEAHPLSAPASAPPIREATLRRYPYVVVYRVKVRRVTVLGVFHVARDPNVRTRLRS